MSKLGPISQAILDHIDMKKGYIVITDMIYQITRKTGIHHTPPWYFRRLVALAFEGRIEARVFRTGDVVAIKFMRLQEAE